MRPGALISSTPTDGHPDVHARRQFSVVQPHGAGARRAYWAAKNQPCPALEIKSVADYRCLDGYGILNGRIARLLCSLRFHAKKPPHCPTFEQPSHSGAYSRFQSDIEGRVYGHNDGGSVQS
jgi:hypothetical protein